MVLPLCATVVGVTGAAAASQAITTFNETQTSLLVVAGLWLVMPYHDERRVSVGLAAFAGILIGVAVGLKLTAMVYLIAAGIALLACLRKWTDVRRFIAFGTGALLGIAAAHGPWSWMLYEKFGNPVFPFFNAIFRSPWEQYSNWADERFFPNSVFDWVVYPFYWAFEPNTLTSEVAVRDPRLLLLLFLSILLIICHLTICRLGRPLVFVVVFGVFAYVIWLWRFSYLRYGIPLEVVSGTLLMTCVAVAWRAGYFNAAVASATSMLIVAGLISYTIIPNAGRGSFVGGYTVSVAPPPEGAIVLLVDLPIAYVAAIMPGRDLRFVGLNSWTLSNERRRQAVLDTLGDRRARAVLALVRAGMTPASAIANIGWRLDIEECSPVNSSIDGDILLCPIHEQSPSDL